MLVTKDCLFPLTEYYASQWNTKPFGSNYLQNNVCVLQKNVWKEMGRVNGLHFHFCLDYPFQFKYTKITKLKK